MPIADLRQIFAPLPWNDFPFLNVRKTDDLVSVLVRFSLAPKMPNAIDTLQYLTFAFIDNLHNS